MFSVLGVHGARVQVAVCSGCLVCRVFRVFKVFREIDVQGV